VGEEHISMAESARRRNFTPALTVSVAQQPAGTCGCHRVSLPACLADEQPQPPLMWTASGWWRRAEGRKGGE
jgi:hypothetical protein